MYTYMYFYIHNVYTYKCTCYMCTLDALYSFSTFCLDTCVFFSSFVASVYLSCIYSYRYIIIQCTCTCTILLYMYMYCFTVPQRNLSVVLQYEIQNLQQPLTISIEERSLLFCHFPLLQIAQIVDQTLQQLHYPVPVV